MKYHLCNLKPYTSGAQPDLFLRRSYTGHEHLPEFGLINMNARLYDPLTGRFLSPDPYVPDVTNSQDYNRYVYARNNPLMYTDPNGEWVLTALSAIFCPWALPAAIYVDFFTDSGYSLQKTVSPVAVKFDFRPFGSNQAAIGFDASIGVPQMFPLSYRVHGGASYYWKNKDMLGNNMRGWETRYGAEWGISGYMFGMPVAYSYGGTTFNSHWSGRQTTNLHSFGNLLFNAKYENDAISKGLMSKIPFIPHGDGDRYRTAAAQINVGPFGIGMNLITGDAGPNRNNPDNIDNINGHDTYVANNGYDPNQYRQGVFYFRAGPFRFGRNSEKIREVFQNRFAHDFMTGGDTKWFEVLNLKPKWWWQIGYGGGTLW
jgi:RHS repeat-associated protein